MIFRFQIKVLVTLKLLIGIVVLSHGQSLQEVTRDYENYTYKYLTLSSDTSIRHGRYKLFYKNDVIEIGTFDHGEKCGRWQYFSLDGIFEFEYDFDENRIVMLSGERGRVMNFNTPCLYLGSPLIPYLYIVSKIQFPKKAKELELEGRVVLALKINKEGDMWSMYLFEKLHPLLDSEVMRVACTIPDDWKWLAATRHGVEVNGEYHIAIEFEFD